MIRQLGHLCFFTNQVEAMVKFYRDGLGLPVKFTLETSDGQCMGYYIDCGNLTFLEIFDQGLAVKEWGGEAKPLTQGTQFRHICLEVTGLQELKQVLETRGIQVTNMKTGKDGSLQGWTADPDGNPIELMEYTPRSKQLVRS